MIIKMHRNVFLTAIIFLFCLSVANAQFKALQQLPWYPQESSPRTASIGNERVADQSDDILKQVNAAFARGAYSEVVFQLYPQAIREGYQRNSNLYEVTRRSLRNLMAQSDCVDCWQQMQQLYADRMRNIGKATYEYRNSLETSAWSDLQLQNERINAYAAQSDFYEKAYDTALQQVRKAGGKVDLAVILQGMFSPLNRAHAANASIASSLTDRYQEILSWIDKSEEFMSKEHAQEFQKYYSQTTLMQVRNECRRVIEGNEALAQQKAQKTQQAAATEYNEALDYYRRKDYYNAFSTCRRALLQHNTPELHILKSNILQSCGNESTDSADRVAFWCAAYEAGKGYVAASTLNQLLEGLRANLFMSGVAGKQHRTTRLLIIDQRVWTLQELREK